MLNDVDLQRFMGLSQSLDSLVTIVGPALAALSIGLVGGVPSLWFTAALSFSAALATATIPRCVGAVRSGAPANEGDATAQRGVVPSAVGALRTGIRVLFRTDGVLTVSTLLTFGIVTFAFSTILGWCYYGEKAMEYLSGKRWTLVYRGVFIVGVFFGAITQLAVVWNFADLTNALMALPNIVSLIGLSGIAAAE